MTSPNSVCVGGYYIKGVTEPLTRVLKKHDITVVNKPFTTLQQQFPAPKFRPSMLFFPLDFRPSSWGSACKTRLLKIKTRQNRCVRNIFFAHSRDSAMSYLNLLQTVRGVILEKPAELLIAGKKNI